MPTRITSIGLHLSATGFYQDVWLGSGVAYRLNNTQIGVTAQPGSGVFLHKTDAGRRDCTWEHSNVYFPVNLGGETGTITVAYLYTNSDYNIQDSGQRTTLLGLLSTSKTQTQVRADPDGVGRYRYWYSTLTSASGAQDIYVQEWGAVQELSQPVEIGDPLYLITAEGTSQKSIVVARKTTPTIPLIYATTIDGLVRYNISGATINMRIARSATAALAGTLLFGPLAVTIDDGPNGEASIVLTEAQTTLTAGVYIADFELVKGGTKLRHLVQFVVTDALL